MITVGKVIGWLWPDLRRLNSVNRIGGSVLVLQPLRWRLLRLLGLNIERCHVSPGVIFDRPENVTLGRSAWVQEGVRFAGTDRVTLGRDVGVATGVLFLTSTHAIGDQRRRAHPGLVSQPITVGDGCWIGARATILPGVQIGPGCVIGAGAVVAKDCDANGLYVGVPARRLRDLPVDVEPHKRADQVDVRSSGVS